MAQAFGDEFRVDALFKHQSCMRVQEIVGAHGRDIGLGDQIVVGEGQVGWMRVNRLSGRA